LSARRRCDLDDGAAGEWGIGSLGYTELIVMARQFSFSYGLAYSELTSDLLQDGRFGTTACRRGSLEDR